VADDALSAAMDMLYLYAKNVPPDELAALTKRLDALTADVRGIISQWEFSQWVDADE
jgi:hypothetical protein